MQCIYFLAVAIYQLIKFITGSKRWDKKCNPANEVSDLQENNSDVVKDSSEYALEICSKVNQSDQDRFQTDGRMSRVDALRGSRWANRAVLTHDALHPIRKHHEQDETYNSFISDAPVAAIQPKPLV